MQGLIQANFDVYRVWAHIFWAYKLRKKSQTKKESLKTGVNSNILGQSYHRKCPQRNGFWGSHPQPSSLQHPPNPQFQWRKIDLCSYHRQIIFLAQSLTCYLFLVNISMQKMKDIDVLFPEILMIKKSCNLIG